MEYRFFVDNDVLRVEPPLVKHELPRDDATLLRIAIQKWETIVSLIEQEGRRFDNGGSGTCALCKVYARSGCTGCPVFVATGLDACDGTPYEDWTWADNMAAKLDTAQAEVIFLKEIAAGLDTG